MFQTLLINPLTFVLTKIAPAVGGYGIAIIILTLIIRLILLPLTLPSMKSAMKMRDLQPELDRLKKVHGNDKMALQQAQMELFKTHQINPVSGCLPNILQFVILIGLYNVIRQAVTPSTPAELTTFLWLNVTKADPIYILPILAGITQLILGLMLLPATSTAAEETLAVSTPSAADDKKAEDMTAMAQTMQQQMIFMMPLITLIIALSFPAGLTLYWVVTTIFSIGQQYLVSGWGGLPGSVAKVRNRLNLAAKK